MRIKRSRLKTYYLRSALKQKDEEGNSFIEYGPPHSFSAEAWPGGGKVQAKIYGQRLPYIWNLRIDGAYQEIIQPDGHVAYCVGNSIFQENDGICLHVGADKNPDFRIISIRPYRFLKLEVERI